MNENVALFVATLFHSGTNAHFFHLSTNSYAQHKALGNFYSEIIDLADSYCEAFMGRYQQIKVFPSTYHLPKEAISYIESLKQFVDEANKDLPKDQELINIVAEIQQLIDSTLYKLRFLK
jgi:hypothetical protein